MLNGPFVFAILIKLLIKTYESVGSFKKEGPKIKKSNKSYTKQLLLEF